MKYIVSVYLSLIGVLYFGFFLAFTLLVSYLLPVATYDPWIKSILRKMFRVMHIRVEVEGEELIDPGKTYLYMANHVSLFDIPLLGGFIPGIVRGVEADRQHRWPLYGWAMGRIGNIPISRENIHGSIGSIRETIRRLRAGDSMIILPEGHRTEDGELNPFKKLPFFLAQQIDKEVVPVGLSGLFHLMAKDSWLIKPTTLKIKFGAPIPVDKAREMATVDLRDYVREEIKKLIEKP